MPEMVAAAPSIVPDSDADAATRFPKDPAPDAVNIATVSP